MISAAVIETSVTIHDNLQSQLLRQDCSYLADQTTHSKGTKVDLMRFLKSLLYINVHVHANKSICESFPVQNDLLIVFSLCHNSADHKQVPFLVYK